MTIVDNAYRPATYRIGVGGSVNWVNAGELPHTVTSSSGAFDSGFMFTGDSYRRTFGSAGTYAYVCTLHPEMTGVVVVGEGGTPPPPTTPPNPVNPVVPVPVGPSDVEMIDNEFLPGELSVSVGQAVTWVNNGELPHTVTGADGSYDSSFVMPGGSFQLTFGAPGTYDYICTIHPGMTGRVLVTGEDTGEPAVAVTSEVPPSSTAPPPSVVPVNPTQTAQLAIKSVRAVDNAFEPSDVRAQIGQTIRWTNDGGLPHTVTAEDRAFDSGILQPGGRFEMSFETAGTFAYICTLHPEMVGTITIVDPPPEVEAAAAVLPSAVDGDFPLVVGLLFGGVFVAAMAFFALGMTRFAKMADAERGPVRKAM